jgi:hypothetical protein
MHFHIDSLFEIFVRPHQSCPGIPLAFCRSPGFQGGGGLHYALLAAAFACQIRLGSLRTGSDWRIKCIFIPRIIFVRPFGSQVCTMRRSPPCTVEYHFCEIL